MTCFICGEPVVAVVVFKPARGKLPDRTLHRYMDQDWRIRCIGGTNHKVLRVNPERRPH